MEQMSFEKTSKMLDKYNLPMVKSKLCRSLEQAKKESRAIGFPCVLKAISPNIVHKSEAGAVKTGISNERELESAYESMLKKTRKISKNKLEGMLLQKTAEGTEVIIGLKRDPQFGPVVLFGLGGVFVEVLNDVSLRVAPIDKKQALEMIKEIKGYPLLTGARGKKPAKIDAIAAIIVKLSNAAESKNVYEIDFNPVIVNEKEAVIADARVIAEK